MTKARGFLVDRCDQCGHVLVRMTPDQHAAVEAVYQDMAWQLDYPPNSGQKWDANAWHQIMLGLFAEEKGWELPKYVPTPKGGVIPVTRHKQSRLSKAHGSELIEFSKSYAIDRGAVVREWDEHGNLIAGKPPMKRAA